MLNNFFKTDKNAPEEFNFFYNNFDIIRLLAALQVCFLHSVRFFKIEPNIIINIIKMFPGVPIFFVTSGFLIAASWDRTPSIINYAKNRMLRIYPALCVCFIVSLIIMFTLFNPQIEIFKFIFWTFGQLTFIQFYNPDFFRGYGMGVMNGSLWTITVELQFYCLLPFIFMIFKKFNSKILLIIAFIGLMVTHHVFYDLFKGEDTRTSFVKLCHVSIVPHLFMFLVGVFFQQNLHLVNRYLKDNFLPLVMLYCVSLFIAAQLGLRYTGAELNPISAVLLCVTVLSFAYSYRGFFSHITKGYDISYGLYIYHLVIVNALLTLNMFNPYCNLVLTIITALICATLSWVFIEKPAMRLKNFSLNKR
jgi:peptidoglycan/LPS O-acetylase OafA/YrhL